MERNLLFIFSLLSILFSECSSLSSEQAYEKGKELVKSGNNKKAYSLFKTAVKKDPKNASYDIAAGTTAPDQNSAFLHFNNAWKKGLKTKTLLSTLLRLSFHVNKDQKVAYGLKLFEELPDSVRTDDFKGELFFQFALYDSALAVWKNQQVLSPSADLCNSISLAYVNKKLIDSALTTLLECKQNGVVNTNTYLQLASLFSMKLDYQAVEKMFAELKNGVYYNSLMKLEHASFLLINDRMDESVKILDLAQNTASDEQRDQIQNQIRVMKAYIALIKNRPQDIDTLVSSITSTTPNGINEKELLNAIKASIQNDSTSLQMLEAARLKNPHNPLVNVICARKNTIEKNYSAALGYYTSLPGLLQGSPRIITETSTALLYSGKEDEALQMVSLLHKHGIYTKQSLEIFRDVAFKKNLLEKSAAAQQLLEKRYGNDINVKWHGFLLAIKEGNIKAAQSIVTELLKVAPDDERFIIAKFSILFLKNDFISIIKELPESGLSPEKIKPLEAMAWLKSGDTTKAISALEERLAISSDVQIMTDLAELYINTNNSKKAAETYKKIIDQTSSTPEDSLQTASILNNYAWVVSSSEAGDLEIALDAAKRAYIIAPDNFHILDTYASILIKSGKYKECIKLLEGNTKAKTQGRLLCHLAESFEKTGDLNKARRYYEDALKMESSDQLPFTMSKEMIKEHIKELLSQKP